MRKLILCIVLLGSFAASAGAHAFLQSAVPPVGSTARGVSMLRLTFTEPLEAAFSTATLDHANGAPVAGAKTAADPHDAKVLIVQLSQPLGPGKYKVHWRVVSTDTHHTQGDYAFTVAP